MVFCRTYVASKGRICAGCIQAIRRVEKQEDQGEFGRYSPVQYLEEAKVVQKVGQFGPKILERELGAL